MSLQVNEHVKRKPKHWLVILCLCWTVNAFATDLSDLKMQGVIGERADGYLGLVVTAADADASQLLQEINVKRRDEYTRIAAANNIPIEKVEALAGRKTLDKTALGNWVYVDSWVQKK